MQDLAAIIRPSSLIGAQVSRPVVEREAGLETRRDGLVEAAPEQTRQNRSELESVTGTTGEEEEI